MKLSKLTVVLATALVTFTALDTRAADKCPTTLSRDEGGPGGGGISGVGGGGFLGFSVLHYLNNVMADSFPQLVQLRPLGDGNVLGCVYDRHFGQTTTPRLVAKLSCEGGKSLKWPYGDQLRVRCSGPMGDWRLDFEAAYLGRNLLGNFMRTDTNGVHYTEAVMIGH